MLTIGKEYQYSVSILVFDKEYQMQMNFNEVTISIPSETLY